MAIQGFFTGDVKIKDLNGVLKAVDGIVEVATDAGTVTSVGLTVGSTGTDVNVANSPVTTSGSITLNIPTSSATNRGLLSSADWSTFNSKQGTITLTTTGSSGAATLIGTTLNIPNYSGALSGYVPYTGATANVNLGEYELKAGQLTLDVSPTGTAAVGTTRWNNTIGSSETTLKGGNVILKNGVDLVARVVNKVTPNTTLTKANYPAVRVSGAAGQRLAVAYAQANNDNNSADTIGLVTETIATNQEGFIMTVGQLLDINTTGSLQGETWADGDVLYLSPTTPGALTNVKPNGSTGHIVVMGYVEYAHANHGSIYVKVMNGWELDELHNVYISSVANNQGLFYESSTQLWKNKSIATVLGYTPANAATTITINGTTYDISTNRTWSVGTVTSIGTSGPITGGTITGSGTIGITQATTSTDGYLSSTDWNTFNSKQAALTFSAPLINTSGTISIPAASASVNGYLSSTDWATFNNKQAALSGTGFVKISGTTISYDNSTYYLASNPSSFITLTALSATAPLSYSNTTGVFSISQATTSTDGYLSSTDWNTFNNKQAAGNYITALTGEATASGPGSASVTLSTSAVTGKLLTGLNLTGGGTIAATDSILQAFGKVQNQISGLAGGVTYQGTWNASTNTPTLTSSVGTKGYYYIVDVAGSTNLNGITDWKVGDWAIFNGSTWDKVDNTDAVSSVNGFTGAVSLTTSNISEGTNLYYLDSRARLALSFTAGSGGYNNTTGVITIPTNTSQLTNGANFITLSSLSASSPLAYNSGTGAFSIQVATGSQNGYLSSTDWTTFNGKQNALTLTTTGSSGSATLVGATLNIPTYTLSGLGGVPTSRQLTINGTAYDLSADRSWSVGTHTGSLTSGYVPKATGSTTLTDGLLYDTGSAVLLGTQTASSGKFMVYSSTADNHYQAIGTAPSFRFADTITSPTYTGIIGLATASNHFIIGAAAGDMVLANNTSSVGNFLFGTGATERMRINATTGNISINNTNNTFRLDVTGTGRFTGQLTLGSTITDGTFTYTLPSGTGTLALTSQLTGGTVTSVGLSSATSGVTIGSTPITTSGTITLAIATASGSQQGLLSSTDWTTFNNKQNALTNPVTGTGTTNYLPKFTGTSTIGNSAIQDDGTDVTITGRALKTGGIVSSAVGGAANQEALRIYNDNGYIGFFNSANTTRSAYIQGNTTDLTLNTSLAIPILFGTSNVTKMTLSASGNLGLGVTPSAWDLGKAIEIGNIGNSVWGVNATQFNILQNAYYSGGYKYASSNAASYYQQVSGAHVWYTAPSGTAGNAISFTQAMTLGTNSGLSIGTTSTAPTNGLLVAGDVTTNATYNITSGLKLWGNHITTEWYNGPDTVFVNYRGYNSGTTQFRSFAIYNGKNSQIALFDGSTGAATFSSSVTTGGNVSLEANEAYVNLFSTYSVGLNARARIRAVGAGGGSGYGGDFRVSTRATNNVWNDDAFVVDYLGRVGIGTTSPANLLHLAGASATPSLRLGSTSAGYHWDIGRENQTTGDFVFNNANGGSTSEKMRITVGGLVGIGTSSPLTRLMIDGDYADMTGTITYTANTRGIVINQDAGGGYGTGIWFRQAGLTAGIGSTRVSAGDWATDLRFYTHPSVTTNQNILFERMRINSEGNVGIGTTSPDDYGSGYKMLSINGSTAGILQLRSGDTGTINIVGTSTSADFEAFLNKTITFKTGTSSVTERMRITSGGNVGIGTSSPISYQNYRYLQINGASTSQGGIVRLGTSDNSYTNEFAVDSSGGYISSSSNFLIYTNNAERMRITSGGDVLVNATSTTQGAKFYVNGIGAFGSVYVGALGTGTVYSNAGFLTNTNPSDRRLKTNIIPLTYGLSDILKLNPVSYNWKDGTNGKQFGFIAQEVQEVMPDAVKPGEYLGLEKDAIYSALVNAIKEQQNQINELKSQLNK